MLGEFWLAGSEFSCGQRRSNSLTGPKDLSPRRCWQAICRSRSIGVGVARPIITGKRGRQLHIGPNSCAHPNGTALPATSAIAVIVKMAGRGLRIRFDCSAQEFSGWTSDSPACSGT